MIACGAVSAVLDVRIGFPPSGHSRQPIRVGSWPPVMDSMEWSALSPTATVAVQRKTNYCICGFSGAGNRPLAPG